MNKKELSKLFSELESLKTLLALRLYPDVEPDIEPSTVSGEIRNGWFYNLYSLKAYKACSHGLENCDDANTKKAARLYSTKKLAYKALLHAASVQAARQLRYIELAMEACDE